MSEPAQGAPNNLGELQHELSAYTRERDSLLATIREARTEARQETIHASCCRQPVEKAKIDHWQAQIKDAAAELAAIEQKIGQTNKAVRALKAVKGPIKSLGQIPKGVAVKADPETPTRVNGEINLLPKEGHVLFLEFFRQLVAENIDPRMVEVLERDAHSLVNDYRATHQKEGP
jgi:hypothetical protein